MDLYLYLSYLMYCTRITAIMLRRHDDRRMTAMMTENMTVIMTEGLPNHDRPTTVCRQVYPIIRYDLSHDCLMSGKRFSYCSACSSATQRITAGDA